MHSECRSQSVNISNVSITYFISFSDPVFVHGRQTPNWMQLKRTVEEEEEKEEKPLIKARLAS